MRHPVSDLVLTPDAVTIPGIVDAIVAAISDGRLAESDPLPSTRGLAAQLGCSRTTTVAAYDELAAAGYAVAVAGSRTVVAPGATSAARERIATRVTPTESATPSTAIQGLDDPFPLRAGRPDATLINSADWRRSWRFAARQPISGDTSWECPSTALESAIIDHVRRHRGIVTDRVLLAAGTSAAITTMGAATGLPAVIEDPGYRRARDAFQLAGSPPLPCPVDDDGLCVDPLPDHACVVYLSPAHQFPMGTRMSLPRRQRIIEWAHDTGSQLIEDDYDGEFRYGVAPLPALRSLPGAADVVTYVGTSSKILTPSLQAAWIISPAAIADSLRHKLALRRSGVATMTATALAHFVSTGCLDRHLARAARTYSARRIALIAALRRTMPRVVVGGIDAGLHVRVDLPDDRRVAQKLVGRGYQVDPVSDSCLSATASGLVIGYGCLPETRARDVAVAIRSVINE